MNELDWAGFRAGDEIVFNQLIARFTPHLLAVVRAYARDDDDASDLLQESWVRIYGQRRSCRGRESVVGWMLTVARNVCRAAGRSSHARCSREALFAQTRGVTELQPTTSAVVHELLAALPERQRDAVTLRIIEGRSTRETAQLLACAEGTVKALLHQGLSTLRRTMGGLHD